MIELKLGEKTFSLSPVPGQPLLPQLKETKVPGDVVALRAQDKVYDLHMVPPTEGTAQLIALETPEGADVVRHTVAHILAQAVKELYPQTQVTIGPVIENGFYYDFSREGGFKEEDLKGIEDKMKEIIKARLPIHRQEWAVDKAVAYFENLGEKYKAEIIRDLQRDQGVTEVSVYWHGDKFVDLCRGPHVRHTGQIPAFKLTHVAGAYWRGNEKNEMLSRIYGLAFSTREELATHLHRIEEAKKRDHRRIGTDQHLFSFHPEAPAAPFFHPNGAHIYIQLTEYLRELNRVHGFNEVVTPLIMSQDLWKTSGHYDNYRENMYFTEVDERAFAVKPMNCPGHCLMFRTDRHSYRELPIRFTEFGRVHRHERSGVTAGLFRVRSFVQDDAHIFCTADQVEEEIGLVLKMVHQFYGALGFEFYIELSTRPEKRMGEEATWDKAEAALQSALKTAGAEFKINPGDGAFYGPKIDFHLRDSLGRTHQCGTIQLDFMMPERFGLEYNGSDNAQHIPVMIHRAIAGSLERFLGIYIEHVAGQFPLWLAPTQAAVLTISDDAKDFAFELTQDLKRRGYRVQLDDSNDKLAGKIKRVQPNKIPYLILIGGREAADRVVSLRMRDGTQRQGVTLDALLAEFETQKRPAIIAPPELTRAKTVNVTAPAVDQVH